jgi:hypothetical protein
MRREAGHAGATAFNLGTNQLALRVATDWAIDFAPRPEHLSGPHGPGSGAGSIAELC